ncbi:MAG: protocatechuate 3,4-dioxygenase subunit alpha [Bauldia litoralis]
MAKLEPTASQTLGPFYAHGLLGEADRVLAGPKARGDRARLTGQLRNAEGKAVRDALIEVWQADADGRRPGRDPDADPDFKGFGRALTDADGAFSFETVLPGATPGDGNRPQAPHFALSVFAAGLTRRVMTRVYVPGAPELETDSLLESLPEAARKSLTAEMTRGAEGLASVVCRLELGGDAPTTFFTD